MMADHPDTEELLDRAGRGDGAARQRLLSRHRHRLRQMITVRLDRRLAARVDPSDIVQEALADAARGLDDYLRDRPVPFYPWLRRFAWERLVEVNPPPVPAPPRSGVRAERAEVRAPEQSAPAPAQRPVDQGNQPHPRALR